MEDGLTGRQDLDKSRKEEIAAVLKKEELEGVGTMEKPDAVLTAPPSYTDPKELYQVLKERILKYHPSDDLRLIEKAYQTANSFHQNQFRKSGEPYIIHPLCVAIVLAELELDKESIVAGLLHDVAEDTELTIEGVESEFGAEVALLVDGVTKLTNIKWNLGGMSKEASKAEMQAENLRKMFLAMAKDIRVILIKLADRLHNMRTLQYMSPAKQQEKARETMEIFSPIASRLGISKVKIELDDFALMYLYPDVYEELSQKLYATREQRNRFIEEIKREVSEHLQSAGIEFEINGRVKHLFSIYKKMVNQNKTLEQIYDVFAVRVIVDSVKDCYAVLGGIHELYKPIPGRFKDYIAMPKPNRYRSLHTTLIGHNGQPFEVQIRTKEMHRVAEYGIAAHWKYKERGSGVTDVKDEEVKLAWLRQILEWQNSTDNNEFMDLLKNDLNLFAGTVFCFTPKGESKTLPKGSTPVDFAYSIHSAVGNRMVGAKINGKLVPIDYEIQNGDRVEILTSQNSPGPSMDWLNVAKSPQARSKINQWFKAERKESNINRGKELIQNYCKTKGIVLSDIMKPDYQAVVLRKYGFRDWDAVLAAIGHGGLKEGQVINRLCDEYKKTVKKQQTDQDIEKAIEEKGKNKEPIRVHAQTGVTVKGTHGLTIRLSRCCTPVPGDEIVGFVTRGRGVTIHRTDCVNMLSLPDTEKKRLLEAEWEVIPEGSFNVEIRIYVHDRKGILAEVSALLDERNINITNVNTSTTKKGVVTINVGFEVPSVSELNGIMNKIRGIKGVIDVMRSIG